MSFNLESAVAAGLPQALFSVDPGDLEAYGRDWTREHAPNPSVIARPRSTEEVQALLRFCHERELAVVPSGGRTGLAGGAVAANGELVLSLERMRKMGAVDRVGRTLCVEAGAITREVHAHAEASGLTWPVDFASAGSSQIGGNIATNAGGLRVVRYGLTRNWVLGLTVVTMQGERLELNGLLEKNNTGPDLRQLFIGTEGILGVITEACLKLTEMPKASQVALLATDSLESVLEIFRESRDAKGFSLLAFEYISRASLELVMRVAGLPEPLSEPSPAYLLVELEPEAAHPDGSEGSDAGQAWLEALFASGLVTDGALAESKAQATQLWQYRERISESLSATGFLHKNDIALPIAKLPAFIAQMEARFAASYPAYRLYLFGHVGDGNLHVNVMKPEAESQAAFLESCHAADDCLFSLVKDFQGSISAEHGIGLLKRPFLGYSRSPQELAYMRAIKQAFDPKGLLNPGKLL